MILYIYLYVIRRIHYKLNLSIINIIVVLLFKKSKQVWWNGKYIFYPFLTVYISQGKWGTSLCNGNALTSSLNSQQRDAYELGYYKTGCSCEVSHIAVMLQ